MMSGTRSLRKMIFRNSHTPPGFALAANWRHFGRPAAGPAPGYVGCGRVGVVRRVLGGGKGELISGNFNHCVGVGIYPATRFTYRVP